MAVTIKKKISTPDGKYEYLLLSGVTDKKLLSLLKRNTKETFIFLEQRKEVNITLYVN